MFKGKIRKCLKCGEVPETPDAVLAVGIMCETCMVGIPRVSGYLAVNYWNKANIPPHEITFILHYYARFNMRLP